MHQQETNHVIVAYASCNPNCLATIEKLHSLMETAGIIKVKRYGLTKNSSGADYGYNLSHPKFDKKNDMGVGIGKLSCVPNPTDNIFQPVCRTWRGNNFALCVFGETPNLNQAAEKAKKKGATFAGDAITPRGTTSTEEISKAEIFLKLILCDKHEDFEKKLISIGNKIEGHYNLAFSINNTYLFLVRKGKLSQPFYIEKLPNHQGFVSATNVKCLDEKNLSDVVTVNMICKFFPESLKEKLKKIKLKSC